MDIVLFALVGTVALELLLTLPKIWKMRVPILIISSGINLGACVYVFLVPSSFWLLLSAVILVYRLINNARILRNRKHSKYLYSTGIQSILILGFVQLFLVLSFWQLPEFSLVQLLEFIALLQFGGAMLLLAWITNSLFQMRNHEESGHFSDRELPAITVAIPARNETNDLSACIDSVLSSNYPKLEILVLDDCSQDATPDIIKRYAHAGVRFLEGTPASNGWLAKNHAYAQLAHEASGRLILFCGVDVRMSPDFLRKLVSYAKTKKKRMVSVLPIRLGGSALSSFIQPMRYWWELGLPRKFLNRPAVLSTCWLIDAKVLKSFGGFEAVAQNILPERYFARECVKHDTYSFLRSSEDFDIRTSKKPSRQISTVLRVRYPQLKNQPENVLIMTTAVYFFTLLPFIQLLLAMSANLESLYVLSLSSIILLILGHVSILRASNPSNSVLGIINFPMVVITDIFLTILSMITYEFGEVTWKGRNVCIPVAHKPSVKRART